MADKKLNEVQKVTDMAYVPVIMADGSVGQIAKADLASVVAEQIASKGTNILYQSSNPKDFNLCTLTGIYGCGGSSAENAPSSTPYGTLIVFNSTALGGGYSIQLFFNRGNTPSVYYRIGSGAWNKLF